MRVIVIYRSESDAASLNFCVILADRAVVRFGEMSPDSAEGNNFAKCMTFVDIQQLSRAERQWSIAKPLAWLAYQQCEVSFYV